jgi:putative sigma-54 modulation protein
MKGRQVPALSPSLPLRLQLADTYKLLGTRSQHHTIMRTNNDTPIAIHITPHHLSLTPALSHFVSEKIAKLPRIAGDALAADVVLRRHHGTDGGKLFSASARLALPGRDLHATGTNPNLYSAIIELARKLSRRTRKRKTRLERSEKNLHRAPLSMRPVLSA